jgi:glycosyltransferase involved in cell wall biosynthesis
MRVSIVTISFNQAEYIEETILSIINQDYDRVEYIVVDAGSTDGSREIIRKYRDKIARMIFEPDSGPADGLNKGFSLATGEIFGFVNGDDVLLPGAVGKVVQAFHADPSIDVVHGYGYVVNAEDCVLRRVYSDPFDARRFAYGCVTFTQPSVFFRRRTFFDVGGFNVHNKTCWDGELITDFGVTGKRFTLLREFLSCFRIHDLSSSGLGEKNPKHRQWLQDRERLFEKVMGRKRSWFDSAMALARRIEKWMHNPTGFFFSLRRIFSNPDRRRRISWGGDGVT